jgi:hypothetical protein
MSYRDTHGAAPNRGVIDHESGEEVLVLASRCPIPVEQDANDLVASAP